MRLGYAEILMEVCVEGQSNTVRFWPKPAVLLNLVRFISAWRQLTAAMG